MDESAVAHERRLLQFKLRRSGMELNKSCRVGVAMAAMVAALDATAAHSYSTPTSLDIAGWAWTQPWDIGNDGIIVGSVSDGVSVTKGFIRNGATLTLLDGPNGALYATASGIADDGTVVGFYGTGDPNAPTDHGFLYKNGSYTTFDIAGRAGTAVRHISSNGRYLTGLSFDDTGSFDGFAYDRLSSGLKVYSNPPRGTIAQGANSQGLVTGSISGNPGGWVHDLNTDTLTLYPSIDGHLRPRFRDINDSGLITGFVAVDGIAMVGAPGDWFYFDLTPGATLMSGYGLNDAGDLVGWWTEADGTTHGWMSRPVPEPSTWALMALGVIGLAARRRSR